MVFSYKEYYSATLIWPLIILIVAMIFLLVILLMDLNIIKIVSKTKIIYNIMFAIFGIVIIISSISSLKYGIYLLSEKTDEAVEISGSISNIRNVKYSPRFYFEDKVVRASIITINEKKYYVMYIDDFNVGDQVTIHYLPKSTIILSINYSAYN